MSTREYEQQIYQELADTFERQHQPELRDHFLILAADMALSAGRAEEAERLRQRLLRANPHHVLRPYASFAQAAANSDIQTFLEELRQRYPVERAQDMLESFWPGVPEGPAPGDFDLEVPATMPPVPRTRMPANPTLDDDVAERLPTNLVRDDPPPPARPRDKSEPLKVYRSETEPEEPRPTVPPVKPTRAPARPPRTEAPKPAAPLPETQPPRAAPKPAAPKPAAPPRPAARPQPAPAPAATRPVAPVPARRPAAPPPPAAPATEPEEPAHSGSWVGSVLVVVVLAAALAFGVVALAPPALSELWNLR
jgi:hypothetical protein